MDFVGNESDQSEDIFSDDDGTGDVKFSSPAARGNTSFLHLSQTPVLFSQRKQETPGKAIVPKTPLSLAPFLSKAEAWTSDLETPEGKQDSIVNRTQNGSLKTPDAFAHDVTLVAEQVFTPPAQYNDEGTEEIVPLSQDIPKSNSRKPKRPPKRRIFGKNNSYYSTLHDEDDFVGNQSYGESKENAKENEVKKSQSCIEDARSKNDSLVTKLEQLRELHRQLKEKNGMNQAKQEPVISDDEFIKKTRELEMCDRIPPKVCNKADNQIDNKVDCKVDNKENEPALDTTMKALSQDDIILSPVWSEFEEDKEQNQSLLQSENHTQDEDNEQMETSVQHEENCQKSCQNQVNLQDETISQHFEDDSQAEEHSEVDENSEGEYCEAKLKADQTFHISENVENCEDFENEPNIQIAGNSQDETCSQKVENNCQIEGNFQVNALSQYEIFSQGLQKNSTIEESFQAGENVQNDDFENDENSMAEDSESEVNEESFRNSQPEEHYQTDENCQTEENCQLDQENLTLDMLTKEDKFSQIDLGIDALEEEEEEPSLDDTIIVGDLTQLPNIEEFRNAAPDSDDEFRGFSVEAQGSRELWYFQQLFRAHSTDLIDKKHPKTQEFKGFSFSEAEAARTASLNNEILLNNYLEKYYGIIQPVEDVEEIISVERMELEESQSSEEAFELPILPPLVVTVYSGFDTASAKKLFVNVEKIVKAQSILLRDENVTKHSIDLLIDSGNKKNGTEVEVSDNSEKNDKTSENEGTNQKIEPNEAENSEKNEQNEQKCENNSEKIEIEMAGKIEQSEELVETSEKMEIDENVSENPSENLCKNSENPDIRITSDGQENPEENLETNQVVSESHKTPQQVSLNDPHPTTNFSSCAGFHTALGKPVEISEKALSMANTAYNGDFSKDYTDCLNELTNLKTKARLIRNQAGGFKPVIPRIAPIKLPAREINSDQNKESRISNVATKDSDKNMGEFKTPQGINKQPPVLENLQSTMNSGFVGCSFGFTTGSGKAVQISEEALLRSKAIFADVEKEVDDNFDKSNETAVKTPISVKTPSTALIGVKTIPPRRPITPSMAKPFVPLNIKKPEFNSPAPSTSTTPISTPSALGFTTGSGKLMKISNEALARSKQLYAQIENETAIEFEKSGQIEPTKTLQTPEMTNPPIKRPTSRPFTPLNLKRPSTPTVGFTTGNGAAIKISEAALQKIRTDMEEFSTDLDSDTNLEDLSNMKQKMWSSRHKPTDLVITKRKNPCDDVTPAGRKRARTGGSDLQARVLFSEIDEEDEELKQAALTIDFNQDNKNDRNLPFKDEVCAEVRACTNAFMEDFERTASKNRWSDSDAVSNPKIIQRRPHSLPDQLTKNPIKNSNQPNTELIPDDLVFDSQEFLDFYEKVSSKLKINESLESRRKEAIVRQEELIKQKKKNREKQIPGSLLSLKQQNSRMSLQSLCHRGNFPMPRNVAELPEKYDPTVLSITPATAVNYQFNLDDFYSRGTNYADGIPAGDGASLIPNEHNLAGLHEVERAFLSSPGVDPNLLPQGWVENHYKWIVWKLASMDRMKFRRVEINRCLTPDQVLKQLKYRYDREIDRAERPIIRRIFEKDESPSHRMILCVSKIDKHSIENEIRFTLELTDGWYSINALIDNPLVNYLISGKIKLGTKLVIYGAQLVNLEDGCHPLESPEAARLKINTNSTRRAKWYAKLGLQKYGGPMELSLGRVNPTGGIIGKVSAVVSRVYPIIYKETMPDGQIIFRNAKSEEKMLYDEKLSIVQRNVTPCLKIRIADAGGATGIVTIWQNAVECSEMLKEGNTITVNHATASGKRSNELQINATRWTTFDVDKCKKLDIPFPGRIFTPIADTMTQSFAPNYGEFDTVGIVVSIGPAPHGMKNFETVNLAWRGDDNIDSFLSLLFWEGVSSYGYSDIATVGSIICCMNCEWRRNTYRSIPTAFCTDRTIITRNPRQGSHLRAEFDCLGYRIGDVHNYVEDCASRIQAEVMKKSGSTPNSITPRRLGMNSAESTPKNRRSSAIQGRIEKLQYYGAPPKLSPINLAGSSRVSLDFRSPLSKPPKT